MSDDLPLTISWKSVTDFFNCPVCMCQMHQTYITPCGHRYCETCIKECIDRHHKCPCCNNNVAKKDLIKDIQFDDLIATASREKEASEKEFFDKLLNTVGNQVGPHHADGASTHPFSPVELVLKKHLKESLAAHERYYQELKHDFKRRKDRLQTDHRNMVDELYTQDLSADAIPRRIAELKAELEEQQLSLEADVQRCAGMVADAYDRYLTEHIPRLSILPVTVTLSILSKSIQLPDIVLKPENSLEDIKSIMKKEMEAKGDKIVDFSPDVKFLYFGPFVRRSLYEMHRMAADMMEHSAAHADIVVLPERCRPVLQQHIKPGGEIAVYGIVRCESDLPKQCFAATFQANQAYTVDYFTCKDCSFNWVCRSCMEVCHRDHEVAPYIMSHQPTWACCYCPKKKKCVIQDN